MDLKLWHQLVTESVWWRKYSIDESFDLYQRAAVAWGMGTEYYAQGPDTVNLTKLFEQYKLLATLKGNHHGKEINSEDC